MKKRREKRRALFSKQGPTNKGVVGIKDKLSFEVSHHVFGTVSVVWCLVCSVDAWCGAWWAACGVQERSAGLGCF